MTPELRSKLAPGDADGRNLLSLLFSIDYRSLAAFRIMTAISIFYICVVLAPNLDDFFANNGILSIASLNKYHPNNRFTILEYINSQELIWILWMILLVAAICLMAGYRSRVAAASCFVIYLSFVGRNPLVMHGGDTLLLLLLFWAIFLPTGRIFGVDGALERGRNLFEDPRILSVATVGLLLQVLYVYVFGALFKTSDYWIPNGQAVYVALHYGTMATSAAYFLREYIIVTALLTYLVFYIELFSPLLLFFPDRKMRVRTVSLCALMLMHVCFRVFLNIGHFWLVSLSSLMTYIPSRVWDGLSVRYWKEEQRRICIYYDRDCEFCLKTCLLLREFFLPHDVFIGPAQDDPRMGGILERENSWVVVAPTGQEFLHWSALSYVTRQSLVMRPVWLLVAAIGAIGLGRVLYDLIGRNRLSLGRVTASLLPFNAGPKPAHGVTKAGLVVVIAICFAWNVDEVGRTWPDRSAWSSALHPALAKAGLSQKWGMFAYPVLTDGYAVVSVKGESSEELYLGSDGALSETLVHPERLEPHFPSYRWRKYFNRIAFNEGEKRFELFADFASWRCDEILSETGSSGHQISTIVVYWAQNTSFRQSEHEYTLERIGEWPCPRQIGEVAGTSQGKKQGGKRGALSGPSVARTRH